MHLQYLVFSPSCNYLMRGDCCLHHYLLMRFDVRVYAWAGSSSMTMLVNSNAEEAIKCFYCHYCVIGLCAHLYFEVGTFTAHTAVAPKCPADYLREVPLNVALTRFWCSVVPLNVA